jgi:hypothetical protein
MKTSHVAFGSFKEIQLFLVNKDIPVADALEHVSNLLDIIRDEVEEAELWGSYHLIDAAKAIVDSLH